MKTESRILHCQKVNLQQQLIFFFLFWIGKLGEGGWWGSNHSAQAPQEVLKPLGYPSNLNNYKYFSAKGKNSKALKEHITNDKSIRRLTK